MTQSQTGAANELLAAAVLTEEGYNLYFPADRGHAVDFVFEDPKTQRLARVQVKTATRRRGDAVSAFVRIHGEYTQGSFEFLAAVCGSHVWLVPWTEVYKLKQIQLPASSAWRIR